MLLSRIHKLFKCCLSEPVRSVPAGAKLDKSGDEPVLVATNGQMMVVVPVDDAESDAESIIPFDALEEATKQRNPLDVEWDYCDTNDDGSPRMDPYSAKGSALIESKESGVSVRVEGQTRKTYQYDANEDDEFPNWRKVLPDESAGEWVEVTFSADLLYALSLALGERRVKFNILISAWRVGNPACFVVRPVVDVGEINRAIGYLMPIQPEPKNEPRTGH